ncbi:MULTISPECIES: hypothetical protein [Chryseobacterium]|uniref:Transcription elongation GreA/GreB family factor n=1 Tax=Chryseobacterium camelliae TaxID=1265445 RepID=A0ABU0TJX6_9FLAO|nr:MULTISPECIES: hypothetical protein [Chryseobacterium]MDT3409031.1 transcription elongation GreA/GreB family factor [Pseudacidovorax intermedius]MDQ1097111.1 transcription elongation GreA/GreB family factor [Chryseobacterium camelliae]MDQ1101048.1 transcription elongation GreA/GreB family factor [Chryseobacterium sp. SORGH_AS_1048]MDR6084491.1 transcription elongation GreA/GreB family factor [Chryseobacterium sp. SORGH_AS_0909]MDR6132761.1 transcription elongation GreA/GreB family factor [Ch
MDKSIIREVLGNKISDKIIHLERLIEEARASNNDTKSSMGDKYETSREMLQQEINNLQKQLNEVLNQQLVFRRIGTEPCSQGQNGALVKTNKGLFYISVSAGDLMVNGKKVTAVSQESPLAKMMFGRKMGDTFEVNTIEQTIQEIW